MSEISDIKKRLSKIEARNRRVESGKKWETSLSRRLLIFILTYFLIGIYMKYIGVSKAWLNALVPSFGFLFSTLTINWVKYLWISRQKNI